MLQPVSWVAAAIGVCVAGFYYVINLREAARNRKIQLSTSVTDRLGTRDFMKTFVELAYLRWNDLDDFLKKYDSSVNSEDSRENFSKRWWLWSTYDNLGYLLREGLVDEEIIFNSQGAYSVIHWGHYWPIIEYYRKKEMGPRWLENFEYLSKRMWEMGKERGNASPGFKDGLMFDSYKDIFEKIVASSTQ